MSLPSVEDFVAELDALIEDDKFSWAFKTLDGICTTIKSTGRVTEGQYDAIQNIKGAVRRSERERELKINPKLRDGFTQRRYEGSE